MFQIITGTDFFLEKLVGGTEKRKQLGQMKQRQLTPGEWNKLGHKEKPSHQIRVSCALQNTIGPITEC